MERSIYNKLVEWKNKQNHKPLILNGARQVGKTYTLQEFGKENIKTCILQSRQKSEGSRSV